MMRRIVAGLIFLSTIGCQSLENTEDESQLKTSPQKQRDIEKDVSESLPPSLWSPSKRKINAQYYFMVAEYEVLGGKTQSAQKLYEAAYNLDPSPHLGRKVVAALAINGQLNSALVQAKKMSLMHPLDAEIRTIYGRLLVEKGLYDKAEGEFRRALELNDKVIEAYLGLIGVYKLRGDISKAVTIATRMVAKNPNMAEGYAILAKLHLSTKNKKPAMGPAKTAFELDSDNPERVLLYAVALELNGKWKEAGPLYTTIYRLNPTNEELVQRIIGLYRQIGSLEEALTLLKNSEARHPSEGLAFLEAFIYWELKDFNSAHAILRKLADEHPESDRNRYMVALSLEKKGDWQEAVQEYQKIGQISPIYLHSRFRSITLLKNNGKVTDALAMIKDVVNNTPEGASDFYILAAQLYAENKQYDAIVEMLTDGVKKYPHEAQLHFFLGVYLERLGRIEDTIEVMKTVIKLKPTHHGALNFLGYMYAESGVQLEEAEKLVLRALELSPNEGSYKDSLGWVYYKKGEYDKAEITLLQAYKAAPQEGVILEHLGDVALVKENSALAAEYFKKALAAKLDDKDRKRVQEKLKGLDAGNGKDT